MEIFNPEANMKAKNSWSADRLVRDFNPCGCGRKSAANLRRGVSRAVTSAATLLLGLVWLARPGAASAQLDYSDTTAVATYVRQMLYWQDADPTNRSIAAFRYKVLLYTYDGTVFSEPTNIGNFYGAPERERAFEAETNLLAGLAIHPDNVDLRNLLLDIYYDRTVAESIYAENAEVKAEQTHFGPPIAEVSPTTPPGSFIINDEISDYVAALQSNQVALATYCALLTNSLGMPRDADGTPLGYHIFQQEEPGRGLDPACYLSNDVPVSVIGNTNALFSGYKDLVLLYELLSQQGSTAATLAHLYFLRNGPGDTNAAQATITEAQRSLFLHTELLRTAFPDLNLNEPALANSGVGTALAGVSDSLAQLDQIETAQRSGLNPLGLDPNFLIILDSTLSGVTSSTDTFDELSEHLNPSNNSELGQAVSALDAAQASYTSYRGDQDQLTTQLSSSSSSYESQLDQIVGTDPSNPSYASYPMGLPGSQLNEQFLAISNAVLKIINVSAQMSNVYAQISIELRRNDAVSNAYISYGNQRASVQKTIGEINAGKDAANAIAQAAGAGFESLGASVAAGGINAAAQASCDVALGHEQAKLENLSALQSADIEGINSSAQVKTWLLNLNTLTVDMQSAEVQYQQQVNLLVALQRQKADLERKLAACNSSLVGRYFADPVHQLTMQADMATADEKFPLAQEWLFFMARALEYKWNQTLHSLSTNEVGQQTWTMADLFKLRNANELKDMYMGMQNLDSGMGLQVNGDDRWDWISVREQLLGYALTNSLGQTNLYVDPVTGQTNDAIGAFHLYLTRHVNPNDNNIEVDLNTVRDLPATFFTGPTYYSDGTLNPNQLGTYLDKMQWLEILLSGNFGTQIVSGNLRYQGTSYIRNPEPGTRDPQHPDQIIGEMTPYSTRHWKQVNGRWQSTEGLTEVIAMLEVPRTDSRLNGGQIDPASVPSNLQNNDFKWRSVATSDWFLQIPVSDLGAVSNLDDIQIYFFHDSFNRE